MDPLSLLCRLATSVPPPRFHTVRYAGVLAAASPWRSRIIPRPPPLTQATGEPQTPKRAGGAKILGVLALLIPSIPARIKEFAYFGFGITLISASIAHF